MPPIAELDPLAAAAALGCAIFCTLLIDLAFEYIESLIDLDP